MRGQVALLRTADEPRGGSHGLGGLLATFRLCGRTLSAGVKTVLRIKRNLEEQTQSFPDLLISLAAVTAEVKSRGTKF